MLKKKKGGRDLGKDDSSVAVVVVKRVGSEIGKTHPHFLLALTLNELLTLSEPPFPQLSKGNEIGEGTEMMQ